MYTQRTPSSFSRSLHLLFFFNFFSPGFPSRRRKKTFRTPRQVFSVFFFVSPLVVFHDSPYIFSLFFLTRPPPFYSNFYFFFFLSFSFSVSFISFLISVLFLPSPPSFSTFSNSIFADSTLNLSVIFQVGLLLFSFLKYRIDLFISFEYRKGNEKKQQL